MHVWSQGISTIAFYYKVRISVCILIFYGEGMLGTAEALMKVPTPKKAEEILLRLEESYLVLGNRYVRLHVADHICSC